MLTKFMAAVLSLLGILLTTSSTSADTTVLLHEAVAQGKVKVDVKSRGGAAGSTVQVEVQRRVPESLKIEVAPGTVLVNAVDAEQNVAVGQLKGEFTRENMYRPGSVMVLADDQKRSFLLEVYCLDYAKKAPRRGGQLELAIQDKRVARILNPPTGLAPSLGAVQIAIWMDRAGISADQARRRFRGETTEVDVQVARQLLEHAEKQGVESIPDDMPASVKVHVTKLFSSNPELRARAAQALGQLGAEAHRAVPFLTENLLERSTDKPLPLNVRAEVDEALDNAAELLEQLGMPRLAPLVESLRQAGSGAMANDVTDLVGDVVLRRLLGQLESGFPAIRARAARVLGRTGNERAIEPLIGLLDDQNGQVRAAAGEALQTLTDEDFGTDAQKWRDWLKQR